MVITSYAEEEEEEKQLNKIKIIPQVQLSCYCNYYTIIRRSSVFSLPLLLVSTKLHNYYYFTNTTATAVAVAVTKPPLLRLEVTTPADWAYAVKNQKLTTISTPTT